MAVKHLILLIDDEQEIADVLNRAASSVFPEAEFMHVTSFAEAVSYLTGLAGRGPRLILLDRDLQSGLDGLDFLALLRQHPQGRLVPVIMLSASRNEQVAQKAYEQGANAFTTKPFSYADWKAYVQQLRAYWFQTATIPRLHFPKKSDS
ncbi:response regulator [Spirosoma oryzicola]|uniref:response regulator n=1 Tax=Spirosoma oryzicola TaxID=2898794 RepID=UPI001E32C813|nr:response regulator [Spirosoma oryzicola]UHG94645.1 response regulator [Spirosoma oryzicola]